MFFVHSSGMFFLLLSLSLFICDNAWHPPNHRPRRQQSPLAASSGQSWHQPIQQHCLPLLHSSWPSASPRSSPHPATTCRFKDQAWHEEVLVRFLHYPSINCYHRLVRKDSEKESCWSSQGRVCTSASCPRRACCQSADLHYKCTSYNYNEF